MIADAGSTKTDWVLLEKSGRELCRVQTSGINCALMLEDHIRDIMEEALKRLNPNQSISKIYYYGAGCATEEIIHRTKNLLSSAFQADEVEVKSDMLGAARALLGDNPGIACILGTGSNSCLYDGEKIVQSVPSLGFILGDEGSGAALGKRLLTSAFKGLMPEQLRKSLIDQYKLDYGTVIENVYRSASPSAYLASFVPFLIDNIEKNHIRELVDKEFNRFFVNNILRYEGLCELQVAFVGGIAYHFADIIKEKISCLMLKQGKIIEKPLESLIEYHRS